MLVLPIKKKWFDMIFSGEKKEEYREVSSYWKKRFSKVFPMYPGSFLPVGGVAVWVEFRNGYGKQVPSFCALCELVDVREGNPEWGAELGKKYYVLKIIKVEKDNERG